MAAPSSDRVMHAYYNTGVVTPKSAIERWPELIGIAEQITRIGVSAQDCVRMVRNVGESPESYQPVLQLKAAVHECLNEYPAGEFERLLLCYASEDSLPRLETLPVANSVRALFRKEFAYYTTARPGSLYLQACTYFFVTACEIATLRRFPGGPMDWVISGIPRSWFAKIPARDLPRTLFFLARKFGGLRPAFFMHVAPEPRSRALVIEKEVRRSYYRMASSLIHQPEMKGILCASWLHDPAMIKEFPHVAQLNEPYLEHGGMITTVGPADPGSGFLQRSPERRKRFESGELRPMLGLALWPRKDAIDWARQHPELDH